MFIKRPAGRTASRPLLFTNIKKYAIMNFVWIIKNIGEKIMKIKRELEKRGGVLA